MKIIIVGAGIIGITTAYELVGDGHEVTVIDQRAAPCLETSYANGGQISASHPDPWASPSNVMRLFRWLFRRESPVHLNPGWDPAAWRWCWHFLQNCTTLRAKRNTERMLRLALYSRQCYARIRARENPQYSLLQRGILHIFRDARAFDTARYQAEVVSSLGCERREISVDDCMSLEPALAAVEKQLVGAMFCSEDESGDAYQFGNALARIARENGTQFRYGETATGIIVRNGKALGVATCDDCFHADAVVLAAGAWSPAFLAGVNLHLPVYPAKGYSATINVGNSVDAPSISLIDDEKKLVYSRLGPRLRAAGMAEFSGFDKSIPANRQEVLLTEAASFFPALNWRESPRFWSGLRPQTPDSVPVIGNCGIEGLLLNTGHGTLGWTMAAGSARVIADLVAGRQTEIPLEGLTLSRFYG